MGLLRNVLTFKTMVSPVVLQLLFWAGIAGTLYGAWVLIKLGNWAWILAITLGPLLVRVIVERAILAFRTYDRLCDINERLVALDERAS